MSSQKKIEINQSSFLSLKAELLRKKQEVREAKLSEFPNKPTVVRNLKLKTKLDKVNEGVNERNLKDIKEYEEEKDVIRKSQDALEAKSKLYEKFVENPDLVVNSGVILVDFSKKEKSAGTKETAEIEVNEYEEETSTDIYDDEDEWVEFVDCLGRTKRCHRDDLESMKKSDDKLRLSLMGRSEARERNEDDPRKEVNDGTAQPELCSEDMRRKELREKWEEEERKLADLKDIHYQHVLFDEARSHGVGYYSFSTDETERVRQLKELENLRKETLEQQAVSREAAKRKKKQTEERLRAARRRKRERLGLPPEEENEGTEEVEEEPTKPEELKREEQVSSVMRPWDSGKKLGIQTYTQEEWIEKRRAERPKEFAPPQSFQNISTKKKRKSLQKSLPEAYLEDISSTPKHTPPPPPPLPLEEEETPQTRRRGAEIPPPPTFELYGPSSKKRSSQCTVTSDMEKSIEEGLNFIRKQVEEKQMSSKNYTYDVC